MNCFLTARTSIHRLLLVATLEWHSIEYFPAPDTKRAFPIVLKQPRNLPASWQSTVYKLWRKEKNSSKVKNINNLRQQNNFIVYTMLCCSQKRIYGKTRLFCCLSDSTVLWRCTWWPVGAREESKRQVLASLIVLDTLNTVLPVSKYFSHFPEY